MPGTPPKATVAAPVKNVPTTVTVLPPAKGPELGRTAETAVWGADTEVEATTVAGLVQLRWTVPTPPTLRVKVPMVPMETEALPAALPAVKVIGEPVASSTVPGAGVPMWVGGTVRLPVVVAGVAPVAVKVVWYVPVIVLLAAARKSGLVGRVTLRPTSVNWNDLPGVTLAGREPVATVPGIVKCVCVSVQPSVKPALSAPAWATGPAARPATETSPRVVPPASTASPPAHSVRTRR